LAGGRGYRRSPHCVLCTSIYHILYTYTSPLVLPMMISKRRVLGDITNSSNVPVSDQNETKKPSIRSSILSGVLRSSSAPSSTTHEPIERNLLPPPATGFGMNYVVPPNVPDRSYMLREVDDIDSRDQANPSSVTTYVNDMYEHFYQLERDYRVNSNYMSQQDLVNEKMRAILVDWLVRIYIHHLIPYL
jgi:hypothetical protein